MIHNDGKSLESEILALFDAWNDALQTGDPKQVVALYDTDAILLPTVSDKVRHTPDEIEDYFVTFLAGGPVGAIDESNVRRFGQLAINSGIYTFTFTKGPNSGQKVQARFTYAYLWTGKRWLITEHHSSRMPESCEKVKS